MKYLQFNLLFGEYYLSKLQSYIIIFILLLIIPLSYLEAQTPAFPGAEGFAKYTSGGRGGNVYKVINLNDSGAGSFREACNASGPRTIVFDVSGNINLNSDIIVTNNDLTIAGQTAPGDGICIRNSSFVIQASNVMVRHLRFRLGDNGYKDASGNIVGSDSADKDVVRILGKTGGINDVIFDHCSMSWSIDEIVEIYGSTNAADGVNDVTFQYCIFSEALYDSHHSSGNNSEGFKMSENTDNVTLYKNLFSSNWEHSIRSEGGCSFEMINNIVYNMRYTTAIGTANKFALINSYFKKGDPFLLAEYMADYYTAIGYPAAQTQAYASGNTSDYAGLEELDGAFLPFEQASPTIDSGIAPDTVNNAITDILDNSGATLPLRDAVDNRIINDYNTTSALIIDTQAEVGGFPTLNSTAPLVDTDNDGMPDTWETANGLDLNDPADRNFLDADGYTNLELYINGFSISFSAGSDLTICQGDSAILTASGGSNYSWNTGETTASITVSPTVTTTYTVSGLDQNSNATSDDITVFVNPMPTANAGANVAICEGSNTTLTASGGDTYAWNTGETTQSITVSPSTTTTYTVSATQNGCTDTDNVLVVVTPLPTANAGTDVTINNGDSTTLTASGGGTYLWNTGETTASITVSPTATTTYSVTVTQTGCEATDDVIVTVNSTTVTANAGADQTICEDESATLTASGGTDYLWSTGETTASITVSPSTTTNYSVTVTEGANSDTDDVDVFVNPLPTANAGTDQTICEGESATLTASGGDTYLWNTGETTQSITVNPAATTNYSVTVTQNGCEATDDVIVTVNPLPIANAGTDVTINNGDSTTLTASGGGTYLWNTGETTASITVSPTATTTYSVTVTQTGCEATDDVIVTVNSTTVTANAGADQTICEGESATLTASGGTDYLWSTGETTASITVSPTITTNYSVTVTEGANSDTDDVDVFVNPLPTANAGTDQTICEGESATLTASGGDAYLWNTGETTQSIAVNPTATTNYSVTVTQNGCEATDDVIVTVNPLPTANAGTGVTINNGDSTTLTASGGGTYLWNTGETTASITVSPTATTTYSVTVTQTGCEATDDVIVTVNSTTVTANAGADQTICEDESATLTASGGTDYLWSTGETTASITVSPTITTNYSVTVTEGANSDTDDVDVFVNPLPTANAGTDVTINNGDSTTLTASGGGTYLWNTGETTASITVSPTATTTYSVTVTQTGCSATDDVIVTVNSTTVTANAGADQTICEGESATLTASGGTDYLWSTGETTASITVNPNANATYTVTVIESENSDTDEVTVFVNPLPEVEVSDNATILQGDYITISATGANSYEWSNGATQPNIAVNPSVTTTYSVKGYINNCYDEKEITVSVVEQVIASVSEDATICSGNSITLNASGGEDYLWNTGESTQSIEVSPIESTTYSVIVSNSLDQDTAEINIAVEVCEEEQTEEPENYDMQIYADSNNPSVLYVKIQGLLNPSQLFIHNINGKLIHQRSFDSNNGQQFIIQLNTAIYNQGLYFITLKENSVERTKRIVFR